MFTAPGTALRKAMSTAAYEAIHAYLHAALPIAFCSALHAVFNLHSVRADHPAIHKTEGASM